MPPRPRARTIRARDQDGSVDVRTNDESAGAVAQPHGFAFGGRVPLARRNLLAERVRCAMSVPGVARGIGGGPA